MAIVGIGIDLVDLQRVERIMKRHGERALHKFLTAKEIEFCRARANMAPHMAARIASKEAAYKALQEAPDARGIGWKEMEVVSGDHGKPTLAFHGKADQAARYLGVATAFVSLSHSDTAAAAVVVLQT